jgi:hypothetical protein
VGKAYSTVGTSVPIYPVGEACAEVLVLWPVDRKTPAVPDMVYVENMEVEFQYRADVERIGCGACVLDVGTTVVEVFPKAWVEVETGVVELLWRVRICDDNRACGEIITLRHLRWTRHWEPFDEPWT